MSLRVAVPDLVSPSYFPAIAAVELGFLPGATLELIYPVTKTYAELRAVAGDKAWVGAVVLDARKAQQALKQDPERAAGIGHRLFPPARASLLAELVRRDTPYYRHGISRLTVASMNRFAQDLGLLSREVGYDEVVWTPG